MSEPQESTVQPRLLGTQEAARYIGLSVSSFTALGVIAKIPPVRILNRNLLFDIRDLDALIDYTKEHGTMRGFKAGKPSHPANGSGVIAISLGELCPGCTEFKITRLPDGGFSVHPVTPAGKAKKKPGA